MAAVSTSRVAAGSYSNVGGLVGTNGLPAKVYHSESSGVLAGKTGAPPTTPTALGLPDKSPWAAWSA